MAIERTILPEGVPPLASYYVYLTGGCNLACRHCWIAPSYQPNGGTGGHLDFDLFKLAIQEGLPLGLGAVKLTGGEPLLHPDFLRMVDLLKENGLALTIETNGTLLSLSLAQYLREKGSLSFISVSLDGATPETHDSFRGVKGSFEKTCNGIRHLVQVGFQPQIIMSLHPGNVREIEPLVRLAEGLGAGSVKFNLIQPTGRGELMREREQILDIQHLVELGEWVEKVLEPTTQLPLEFSWPLAFLSLGKLLKLGEKSCRLLNILGILPDGHLAMCGIGIHETNLCYGRLGENSVESVWFSHPVLQELRNELVVKSEGICRECLFHERCLGHCVAENYFVNRRLTAPFWFCQQTDEVGLFPINRKRTSLI
jgi:SynChlorMet cassette radical SAM/SPASM protein ScmF